MRSPSVRRLWPWLPSLVGCVLLLSLTLPSPTKPAGAGTGERSGAGPVAIQQVQHRGARCSRGLGIRGSTRIRQQQPIDAARGAPAAPRRGRHEFIGPVLNQGEFDVEGAVAIERGLAVFEGGAQGEHKLARGFEPVTTFSSR